MQDTPPLTATALLAPLEPLWLRLVVALVVIGVMTVLTGAASYLPARFMLEQDGPVAILGGLVLVAAGIVARRPAPLAALPPLLLRVWPVLMAAAAALLAFGGAGLVFQHFPLSMDEFWAVSDGQTLLSGHTMAPIPAEWRDFVPALQPMFRVAVEGNTHWSSDYRPVNALLQAGLGTLFGPGTASAALLALAIAALWSVARHAMPQNRAFALTAVTLLATSAQALVIAMTPYAMTAHLALNLLWLALILRDRLVAHLAAAVVAFLAVGLHQVVFFPLFAAPFILSLWQRRAWAGAVIQTSALLMAGLVWSSWSAFAYAKAGAAPVVGAIAPGPGVLVETARILLSRIDVADISLMAQNLLRLVTWQNPLTVPLVLLGLWAGLHGGALRWKTLRQPGLRRDLWLGIVLTLCATSLLMPYQGHGWGYRYMHGLLGNLCLLAAFVWADLVARLPADQRPRLWSGFALVAALSVLALLPIRALQAHGFAAPFARASAAISASPTPIVVVDTLVHAFAVDLVRNPGFPAHLPAVLSATDLTPDLLARACARGPVARFGPDEADLFGLPRVASPAPGHDQMITDWPKGCGTQRITPAH